MSRLIWPITLSCNERGGSSRNSARLPSVPAETTRVDVVLRQVVIGPFRRVLQVVPGLLILVTLELLRGPAALLVPLDLGAQRAGRVLQRAQVIDKSTCAFAVHHDDAEAFVVVPQIAQRLDIGTPADEDGVLERNQERDSPPEFWRLAAKAGDAAALPVVLVFEEAFDALDVSGRAPCSAACAQQAAAARA